MAADERADKLAAAIESFGDLFGDEAAESLGAVLDAHSGAAPAPQQQHQQQQQQSQQPGTPPPGRVGGEAQPVSAHEQREDEILSLILKGDRVGAEARGVRQDSNAEHFVGRIGGS